MLTEDETRTDLFKYDILVNQTDEAALLAKSLISTTEQFNADKDSILTAIMEEHKNVKAIDIVKYPVSTKRYIPKGDKDEV